MLRGRLVCTTLDYLHRKVTGAERSLLHVVEKCRTEALGEIIIYKAC